MNILFNNNYRDISNIIFQYFNMNDIKQMAQVSKYWRKKIRSKYKNYYIFYNNILPTFRRYDKEFDLLEIAIIFNDFNIFKYIYLIKNNDIIDDITRNSIINSIKYDSYECFIYLLNLYIKYDIFDKNIEDFIEFAIINNNIRILILLFEIGNKYSYLDLLKFIYLKSMYIPSITYEFFIQMIDLFIIYNKLNIIADYISINFINDAPYYFEYFDKVNYLLNKIIENNIQISSGSIIGYIEYICYENSYPKNIDFIERYIKYVSQFTIQIYDIEKIKTFINILKGEGKYEYIKIIDKLIKN